MLVVYKVTKSYSVISIAANYFGFRQHLCCTNELTVSDTVCRKVFTLAWKTTKFFALFHSLGKKSEQSMLVIEWKCTFVHFSVALARLPCVI